MTLPGALLEDALSAGRYLGDPHPAPRDPASYPPHTLAWGIVAMLFVANIFSFIDRMIIGLLVEPIKADLGLSDTEISLLQGLAFALFFTIAGLPLGRLIDRLPRLPLVAAGIATWSIMTALCSQVSTFWQFFLARTGVGVGEAVLSPAAYSIIADSFPPRRLGLAIGIYGLGSAIGAGLAFMIGAVVVGLVAGAEEVTIPVFGTLRSWQVAFLCAGLPGLLFAAVFLILPEPQRHGVAKGDRPSVVPLRTVAAYLRRNWRLYAALFGGVSAVNFAVLGSISWFPSMLIRVFALDTASAGYLAGALLIAGGLVGMVGGGALLDRLGGGTPASRMRVTAWATLLGIGPAAIFPLTNDLWLGALAFFGFFVAAAVTVAAAPSAIQQLSPVTMRGTIAAAYVFVINLVGLGGGPTVTAMLGDRFFPQADGIRNAIALVAPGGYLVAAVCFFLAARLAQGPSTPTVPAG